MDLRKLRYFVATAEELHFGRAARRLGLSQPPLSMQLRALELDLGAKLFDRDNRNVALTHVGAILLVEARKILRQVDQARVLVERTARGEYGKLSVGFITPVEYTFLPPLLREFKRQCPGVTLQLRELTSDIQSRELAQGTLDVGFLIGPAPTDQLSHQELMAEPLIAAIPKGHRLSGASGKLSVRQLANEDVMIFPRAIAPALFDETLAFCQRAGFSLRIAQEVHQSQTIISLASAGIGIALVPASMRHLRRKGVVYRAFAERVPRMRTFAAWSPDARSPLLERFVKLAFACSRKAVQARQA
jgi:DNA-binding transcriptional LysR family regulator